MQTLFNLASQRATWLSERQALISQNVANANTPGYKTQDAPDFASVLSQASETGQLSITNANHMSVPDAQAYKPIEASDSDIWDGTHAENTVNLEQEMVKANQIHADYSLEAGVVKSFQSMILASLKG